MITPSRALLAPALCLSLLAPLARADDAAKQTPAPAPTAPAAPAAPTAPAPDKIEVVYVKFETSMGDILLELDRAKAPITVDNFVKYVDKGHFTDTIFHRVIKDFMIQGGGFTIEGTERATEAPIKNEWRNGLKNVKYAIAMARTSNPDSATAQFFINTKNNPALDGGPNSPGYAVFGKVVAGFDVVDKIAATPVQRSSRMGGENSEPVTRVDLKRATKLSAEDAKALLPKEEAPAPATPGTTPAPAPAPAPAPQPRTPEQPK